MALGAGPKTHQYQYLRIGRDAAKAIKAIIVRAGEQARLKGLDRPPGRSLPNRPRSPTAIGLHQVGGSARSVQNCSAQLRAADFKLLCLGKWGCAGNEIAPTTREALAGTFEPRRCGILSAMTEDQLRAVFERVLHWPRERQEDAAGMLAPMEGQDASPYCLSDEQAGLPCAVAFPRGLSQRSERLPRQIYP